MQLLTYFSFDQERRPYYLLTDGSGGISKAMVEFGRELTLKFDTTKRYCIGGHEIGTSENWACPDSAEIDKKYEQCKKCMNKTGFNPAFYNTSEISDKQAAYNKQPHTLYLAYFDDANIKVGISHEHRGISRLLEQGARAAIVLERFGSANVARQYEAKVSGVEWIAETLQLARKMEILGRESYDFERAKKKLLKEKARIETEIKVEFKNDEVINLDMHYGSTDKISDMVDVSDRDMISGEIVACVGSILVAKNGDDYMGLSLKKYVGYMVELSNKTVAMNLPPKQFSLF